MLTKNLEIEILMCHRLMGYMGICGAMCLARKLIVYLPKNDGILEKLTQPN